MVVEEIIRQLTCLGRSFDTYFHRTSAGAEVDLVLDGDFGLVGVEIKHTRTIVPRELRTLSELVREHRCRIGIVIHNDRAPRRYDEKVIGIPFSYL